MISRTSVRAAMALLAAACASLAPSAATAAESCQLLRWTTLGTAGGPIPTLDRGEPANMLEVGDMTVLVDTGDGTANAIARAGKPIGAVRTIFLSHLHWDHAGGLGAVIGLRWMNEYADPLTVYGPKGTRELVDGILASLGPPSRIGFGLGEAPRSPGEAVRVVEVEPGEAVKIGDLTVRTAENTHYDAAAADVRDTASLSYRFEYAGRAVTYTGDTGPSPAVTSLAAGSGLLVSEVISLEPLIASIRQARPDMPEDTARDMRRHLSAHHLPPGALGQMASEADIDHLVLTHYAMAGSLAENAASLLAGVREFYRGPIDLSRDMQSFDVGCRAKLETTP